MLLEVLPWIGDIWFKKRVKLGQRYIVPFRIISWVGMVAYRLDIPENLSRMHNTLHVSQLRKCLTYELVDPLDDIQID